MLANACALGFGRAVARCAPEEPSLCTRVGGGQWRKLQELKQARCKVGSDVTAHTAA